MKLLITTLTMIFINFGASAEYNKKFTELKCQWIFNNVNEWLRAKSEFSDCPKVEDSICSRNFRLVVNEINLNRNLYETFCKD
jgi:hypothetical protein